MAGIPKLGEPAEPPLNHRTTSVGIFFCEVVSFLRCTGIAYWVVYMVVLSLWKSLGWVDPGGILSVVE